jgi:hypothetical protein
VLQQRVAMTASDAGALSGGEMVVVQPILALTVAFSLPIGARL